MLVVLEHNVKHGVTLGMLNECFNQVKDQHTKIDMLHQAVCILDLNLNGLATKGRGHFSSLDEGVQLKSVGGALCKYTAILLETSDVLRS
jgi:hypothetical protein